METGAVAAALGSGVGASIAIEGAIAAGGLTTLGAAAVPVLGAAGSGILAAGYTGWNAGGYAYEHSETVQDLAQGAIGLVSDAFDGVWSYFSGIGEHSCTYPGGGGVQDYFADYSWY